MRRNTTWWALVLASVFAVGCKTNEMTMVTNDASIDPTDAADATPDVGPDTGPTGDGNDSFADADPLLESRVEGAISRPGDLDYYSFNGTAGQWFVIGAAPTAEDEEDRLDTVITLFDSSMNRIAESDDEIPRTGTGSGIYTRLPQNGTYYILVQDFSTWTEGEIEPEGKPSFTYELVVGVLSPASATIDPETGNDAEYAQTVEYSNNTGLILGTFNNTTDVDVFAFTIPEANVFARFILLPGGPTGMGYTGQPRRIWIENEAGQQIAGNTFGSQISLQPHLPAGNYFLFVSAPETMGENDFYVIKSYRFEDNPLETMEATNDVVTTPEPLTFSAEAPPERWGYVLAQLGDGDVDHFSITTIGDEQVTVACTSRSSGSGILGLRADLLTVEGDPLDPPATSTETDVEGALLFNVTVPSAGTYVLRLTRMAQDPELTGDWVRCGVRLLPASE